MIRPSKIVKISTFVKKWFMNLNRVLEVTQESPTLLLFFFVNSHHFFTMPVIQGHKHCSCVTFLSLPLHQTSNSKFDYLCAYFSII